MKQKYEHNLAISSLKFVAVDLIGDFLYWPVWWFTIGAGNWALYCLRKVQEAEAYLGLRIWAANLFTPMFQQYDWQGRLISFIFRVFMIIFKAVVLVLWVLLLLILFLAWFVVPLYVAYQIWSNLNSLFLIN